MLKEQDLRDTGAMLRCIEMDLKSIYEAVDKSGDDILLNSAREETLEEIRDLNTKAVLCIGSLQQSQERLAGRIIAAVKKVTYAIVICTVVLTIAISIG